MGKGPHIIRTSLHSEHGDAIIPGGIRVGKGSSPHFSFARTSRSGLASYSKCCDFQCRLAIPGVPDEIAVRPENAAKICCLAAKRLASLRRRPHPPYSPPSSPLAAGGRRERERLSHSSLFIKNATVPPPLPSSPPRPRQQPSPELLRSHSAKQIKPSKSGKLGGQSRAKLGGADLAGRGVEWGSSGKGVVHS